MSLETKKKLHLIYGIFLSLLFVATGVALAVSCVHIYQNGGEHPFSREAVEGAFDKIAVLVYVTIGAVVVGGLLRWIFPLEKVKTKGRMHPQDTIRRLWTRVDHVACQGSISVKRAKEIKLRHILRVVAIVWSVILAIPAVVYVFDLDHFTRENLNGSVISLMYYVLPATVLALGGWLIVQYMQWRSFQRELEEVKEAVKLYPAKEKQPLPVPQENTKTVWIIRGVVLLVAVIFVVLGIFNGGMTDVLEKAIKICTECIGLG